MSSNTTNQSSQTKEAEDKQNSIEDELTNDQLKRLKEAERLASEPISVEETSLSEQQKQKIIEEEIMKEPSNLEEKPVDIQKSVIVEPKQESVKQPNADLNAKPSKIEEAKIPQEPKIEISPEGVSSIPKTLEKEKPKLEKIEALTEEAPSSESLLVTKTQKPAVQLEPQQIEQEKSTFSFRGIIGFFLELLNRKKDSSNKILGQPQKESVDAVNALKKGEDDAASIIEDAIVATHPDEFQAKRDTLQPISDQNHQKKTEIEK